MRLSTKATYGLRAMLAIALGGAGDATSVAEISEREGISVSYLEQLLNRLRRRGLVKSVRGPNGGYVLNRDARGITVSDIVTALEGDFFPLHCVSHGSGRKAGCSKRAGCVPKIVWLKLARAITDCLDSVTLGELCSEARKVGRLG